MDIKKLADGLVSAIEWCVGTEIADARAQWRHIHEKVSGDFLRDLETEIHASPTVKFRWNKELWPDGNPAGAPSYKTDGAVAIDLVAAESMDLPCGMVTRIRTGFHIELPTGWRAQIEGRSGMASRSVQPVGGVIDTDFRGSVDVLLAHLRPQGPVGFMMPVKIERGDRIAQLVICRSYQAKFVEVDELSDTARGEAGFGSTGVK